MWGVYVCVGGLEGEAEVKEKLRHVLMTLELFEGITEVHAPDLVCIYLEMPLTDFTCSDTRPQDLKFPFPVLESLLQLHRSLLIFRILCMLLLPNPQTISWAWNTSLLKLYPFLTCSAQIPCPSRRLSGSSSPRFISFPYSHDSLSIHKSNFYIHIVS